MLEEVASHAEGHHSHQGQLTLWHISAEWTRSVATHLAQMTASPATQSTVHEACSAFQKNQKKGEPW